MLLQCTRVRTPLTDCTTLHDYYTATRGLPTAMLKVSAANWVGRMAWKKRCQAEQDEASQEA